MITTQDDAYQCTVHSSQYVCCKLIAGRTSNLGCDITGLHATIPLQPAKHHAKLIVMLQEDALVGEASPAPTRQEPHVPWPSDDLASPQDRILRDFLGNGGAVEHHATAILRKRLCRKETKAVYMKHTSPITQAIEDNALDHGVGKVEEGIGPIV
jgi:hypothetical protein